MTINGGYSGYTGAMKLVPILMREWRLLMLCTVSLALHLIALDLFAPSTERTADAGATPCIAVTLQPAATAPGAEPAPPEQNRLPHLVARPVPTPEPAIPPAIVQSAKPDATIDATIDTTPVRALATTPDATPATALATTPPAKPATLPAPPIAGAGWNALTASEGEVLIRMPGRYRTRMPPSALLTFELTRSDAGQAPVAAGAALIDWRIGPTGYSLGVEGVAGALTSEGEIGDNGIAPASASETQADGALATTRFDYQARRIEFGGSKPSVRLQAGSLDRAALLLQLAAIGLAEPDQIKEVLEFYVGTGVDAGVVRFQVLGPEPLATALGTLDSVHLAQLTAPGETRLEVWLAPQHHWLPVQLRVSAFDGSVLTQRVSTLSTISTINAR